MRFKVGDRVQRKSGEGPVMTVEQVHGTSLKCTWFKGVHQMRFEINEPEVRSATAQNPQDKAGS